MLRSGLGRNFQLENLDLFAGGSALCALDAPPSSLEPQGKKSPRRKLLATEAEKQRHCIMKSRNYWLLSSGQQSFPLSHSDDCLLADRVWVVSGTKNHKELICLVSGSCFSPPTERRPTYQIGHSLPAKGLERHVKHFSTCAAGRRPVSANGTYRNRRMLISVPRT